MAGMSKSRIGYHGIGADGRPINWYYAWNVGGFGCSRLCDGCWAHAVVKRFVPDYCPDCAAFRVHMHPERLGQPANTKKPGVVLCNFTNDWLDPVRPDEDVSDMISAMVHPHSYVTLTKNFKRLASVRAQIFSVGEGQYDGVTIRNQREADQFNAINDNMAEWVSLEPLEEDVSLHWTKFYGVIVGQNNTRGEPGTDTQDHVWFVVEECKRAGVRVFVKQLHMFRPETKRWFLATDPKDFPADLRFRDLPWSMPKENGNG